jgi:hypothetical protein
MASNVFSFPTSAQLVVANTQLDLNPRTTSEKYFTYELSFDNLLN